MGNPMGFHAAFFLSLFSLGRNRLPIPVFLGFPGGSDGKESSCNMGDVGSIPGLGRSMFQCYSPKSSHPLPLPLSPKVRYAHLSFLLSCIQGHHCHLSKFHIYVLVYCIGVFLSGLLHSV